MAGERGERQATGAGLRLARVPLVIESVSRDEVLRYLGYRGQRLTPELDERIDAAVERCLELVRPRASLASYPVVRREPAPIEGAVARSAKDASSGCERRREPRGAAGCEGRREPGGASGCEGRREPRGAAGCERAIVLSGCTLRLAGRDIARHLADAVEVVLLAVTLGADVDRELRCLSLTDPATQVVFDAAATAVVEAAADAADARARAYADERGLYASTRFSPGYGDLPLDCQPDFLAALDAQRQLGITLTPSNLMVPTKSVSALVGIHPTPQAPPASSCAICSLAPHCTLRAQGRTCRGS